MKLRFGQPWRYERTLIRLAFVRRFGYGKLPRVTFTQLRALVAVARVGNVTRAAEELGTTQSAVSHALRNFERELDVALFVRRSDGVELTPIGAAIRERAGLILNQLEGLRQDAAAERGRTRGRLRVGVIPSINARLLPSILGSFSATSRAVEVSVLEGSDAEVLEWLRTCAVDIATVTSEAGDLATTALATDRWMAVLPEDHRLSAQSVISISDLAREPFIMSAAGCEPAISLMARRAGVELRSHYRVRDTNSLVAMVAERLGVTIMPELALPARLARIHAVPLHPIERREVSLAVLTDALPLPSATAFIAHAANTAKPARLSPAETGDRRAPTLPTDLFNPAQVIRRRVRRASDTFPAHHEGPMIADDIW